MSCREQGKGQLTVQPWQYHFYLSNTFKAYPQVACAREVLSIFVEGNGHNTVGGVESLLHSVPMMDVNIYVQNSLVVSGKRGKVVKF